MTSNATLVLPRGGEQKLRETFLKFDTNRDGLLSRAELKKAFEYLGAIFPGFKAGRGMHHADENHDGFIDELEALVIYATRYGYNDMDSTMNSPQIIDITLHRFKYATGIPNRGTVTIQPLMTTKVTVVPEVGGARI